MPHTNAEAEASIEPPLAAFIPLVGFLVFLTLAAVLDPTRGHLPVAFSLTLFAIAVAGCSLAATPTVALLLAGCAWLDYDGFVVGQEGNLAWHGGIDVTRIAILGGTALLTLGLRSAVRSRRRAGAPR